MKENRREFFRVFFKQSVDGEISIDGGDYVAIKINDISVNGLKFLSDLEIPMDKRVMCSFEILDTPFLLDGAIVRKESNGAELEYGVGFSLSQSTASQLFKQLNLYQIRQRRGIRE